MTGINYYIKFFADGVASQWLSGYGLGWYKTNCRGFGIWRTGEWSAIELKNEKIIILPQICVGVWWVFHFSLLRIPINPKWNGW